MINKRSILDEDLRRVAELLGGGFSRLKGKKIFLTGGTGFFGRWLIEFFLYCNRSLHADISLTVLSRNPDAFVRLSPEYQSESLRFMQGDVKCFDFPEENFDFIFHAAASTSVEDSVNRQLQTIDTIVSGTRRILEFAALHPPESLLLVSSGAVYGSAGSDMLSFSEAHAGGPDPLASGAVYGAAKRFSELLAATYFREYGINTRIARCFSFVGPFMPLAGRFAVANFIGDLLADREIRISGDGTPLRSYLYAADLVLWLIRILLDASPITAYNVGSDEGFSIKEVAQIVAMNSDKELPILVAQAVEACSRPQRYLPDIRKAKLDLGLNVNWQLSQAIERTVAWHKADD